MQINVNSKIIEYVMFFNIYNFAMSTKHAIFATDLKTETNNLILKSYGTSNITIFEYCYYRDVCKPCFRQSGKNGRKTRVEGMENFFWLIHYRNEKSILS